MKASELRIGNMVLINGKIVIIDTKMFHAVIHGFPGYETEPIPLTEEWLIKFGFIKDLDGDAYKDVNSNSFLCWQNDRVELLDDENNKCITYCEHVHQLQNLYFALTGEELILIEKL